MPVEHLERRLGAEPASRHGALRNTNVAPSDLLAVVTSHAPTHRLRHELSTQAMANDRHIGAHATPDQLGNRPDPWRRVVHAHGATHQGDAAKRRSVGRDRLSGIDPDQLPGRPQRDRYVAK